jgi:hypothetical protein
LALPEVRQPLEEAAAPYKPGADQSAA